MAVDGIRIAYVPLAQAQPWNMIQTESETQDFRGILIQDCEVVLSSDDLFGSRCCSSCVGVLGQGNTDLLQLDIVWIVPACTRLFAILKITLESERLEKHALRSANRLQVHLAVM